MERGKVKEDKDPRLRSRRRERAEITGLRGDA